MKELRMAQPVSSMMQGRQFRRLEQQQDTEAGYASNREERSAQSADQQKQLADLELTYRKDKQLREEDTRNAEETAGNVLSLLESPESIPGMWPQVYEKMDDDVKALFPEGQWNPEAGTHVVQSAMSFMDRMKQIHQEEAAESKSKSDIAKEERKSQADISKEERKSKSDIAKLEKEYELKSQLEKTKATEKAKTEGAKGKGGTNKIKNFEYLVKEQGMAPDVAAKRIFGSGVRVITNMTGGAAVIDEDSNKIIGEMSISGEYTPAEDAESEKPETTTKSWLERKYGTR